jgi:SAM-dependent methyltransferase
VQKKPADGSRFDKAYYRRYYLEPRTRVATRAEMGRRADLIAAFARHAELRVRSILDLGCGLGLMRSALLRSFPAARYTGVEASAYLCEKYGWEQGSADTYRSNRRFDIVICNDVLQYLPARQAAAAIDSFTVLCRGILYFGALTTEDWDCHCDQRLTDSDVYRRPAGWYRRRLATGFIEAGVGMFLHRDCGAILWALEKAAPRTGRGPA